MCKLRLGIGGMTVQHPQAPEHLPVEPAIPKPNLALALLAALAALVAEWFIGFDPADQTFVPPTGGSFCQACRPGYPAAGATNESETGAKKEERP